MRRMVICYKYTECLLKSKHKIYIQSKNVLIRICRPHLGKFVDLIEANDFAFVRFFRVSNSA